MAAKQIMIVGFEEKDTRMLLFVLEGTEYAAFTTGSLPDAVTHLQEKSFGALIIDLDHACLDNRLLKQIRAKHPNLCLIGLSSRSFHPELEEALSLYIDACFSKSPGYEELL